MKAFNLEKALAGEKVVTRDGQEVTQVTLFNPVEDGCESIGALIDGRILVFYKDGSYMKGGEAAMDLFMTPKKLSGFINTYSDLPPTLHLSKLDADCWSKNRTACVDLSQLEEGHGL